MVLLFGVFAGSVVAIESINRIQMGRELDFHAYYFAGKAVLNGDDFVGTAIQSESFLSGKAYVYPPITAIVFTIYGFTPHWQTSYIFHIILTLSTLFLLARCTMALIERHSIKLDIIDRVLIVGFHLFSVPAMLAIYRGNVDPFILLAIVSGFFALEQGRQASAGAIWSFAAIFKLFPAVLGIWFLFQRSWRAIIVAVGVGFSSLGIGVAIFGIQPHLEFFEYLLTERSRNAAFSNGLDPNRQWITIRRPLSHLFPLPGHMLTVIGTLIFLPALLYLYRRIESDLDSLFAVFATLAIALITIVPSTTGYVVYLLFPTVALVYVINEFIPWLLFLGGIVLINLPIYPKHIDRGIAIMGSTGPMVDGFQLVVSTMLGFMSVGLWGFLFVIAGYLLSVSSFENSNHTGPP